MSTMTQELADLNPHEARRMAQAIAHLSRHYRDQPRLEDAAAQAGLSPHHFQRLFTRWVGVSPKKFVGYLTLDHAKALLRDSASVLDAALDSGLSGPGRLHDLSVTIDAVTPGEWKARGEGLDIAYGFAASLFGETLVMMSPRGLCGLAFADPGGEEEALADMMHRWPRALFREDRAMAEKTVARIFAKGEMMPLHLIGTPWQVKVWEALLRIPPGRLVTYEDIAVRICTKRASRAVGTAVGLNPISWAIPCHRVLRKSGLLAGYHWGLDRKRAMLAVEAARALVPNP